jgi:hypothetical protein
MRVGVAELRAEISEGTSLKRTIRSARFSACHFLSCLLFGATTAIAQTGSIAGTVVDSSGAVVMNATVELRELNGVVVRRTAAGADGSFEVGGLEAGEYDLAVSSAGLAERRQRVTVAAGGKAALTITLAPSALSQQVEVTAMVDAVSGAVTKMDIPLLETPQAISVIPPEQIDEQKPLRLEDALRYSAGVAAGLYGLDARGDWAAVRGGEDFGQYLNGLRMLFNYYNNTRPDPFALERVEVMRGPSSVLFGQSGFGGVINLVRSAPCSSTGARSKCSWGATAGGRWRSTSRDRYRTTTSGFIASSAWRVTATRRWTTSPSTGCCSRHRSPGAQAPPLIHGAHQLPKGRRRVDHRLLPLAGYALSERLRPSPDEHL